MKYSFDFLKNKINELQDEKRFKHTIGVANEAFELGKIFLPEKKEKLMVAGLLHDITKCFTIEKQIELCKIFNISYNKETLAPKLFHAKTGCEFSREIFGIEIVDDEIYNSILYHTTGRADMTLFETIIYLADYIEAGRTFFDCVELRKFFYDNIVKTKDTNEKLEVLRQTMLLSFDMTIKNLINEQKAIDYDTINARNFFLQNTPK
ncbi:MAG: bis(5'-nucleosyl)-tetraphosphatase (symmetrical) YqeK [Clostridia bacterium]|nr:bis(5'-nucleosyl)-tetraphosphatase (symmetrical) YqeK [Clostridia bacterium]